MADLLWTEVFFAYEPLVGFDEAVRIAEEHVPTIGTVAMKAGTAPNARAYMRRGNPTHSEVTTSPSRPNTASAQADRGGGRMLAASRLTGSFSEPASRFKTGARIIKQLLMAKPE